MSIWDWMNMPLFRDASDAGSPGSSPTPQQPSNFWSSMPAANPPTYTASDAVGRLMNAWQRGSDNYAQQLQQLGLNPLSLAGTGDKFQQMPGFSVASGFGPADMGVLGSIGPVSRKSVDAAITAYHGSPHSLEALDPSRTNEGVWLSPDAEMANHYTGGNGGNIYTVKVNASPDEFISRNAPIGEQSDAVRNMIDKIGDRFGIPRDDGMTGNGFYSQLTRKLAETAGGFANGRQQAMQLMREYGVPGLRDDADVLTLFDADRAKITHVNGTPIKQGAK